MPDKPRIDPDFQKLLPPLSPDELAELEASILDEGVRDPLVVWRGILLDGHNRLAIAEKHSLPYREQELDLPDRDAARRWIIRNQLGRRNLTADWVSYLRGQDAREAPKDKGGRPTTAEKDSAVSTPLQTLAEEHGVTERTLRNDANFSVAVDAVAEAVGDEARPTLLSGGATRSDVEKLAEVAERDPETAKKVVAKAEEIRGKSGKAKLGNAIREVLKEETPPPTIPEGRFSLVYADPPWQYSNNAKDGAADDEYQTMSTEDLCALPVADRLAKDAVLFLWVTNPLLIDGLAVLSAWGFSYKTNLVWVKDRPTSRGLGFYLRGQHELLLIGTRGSMIPEKDAMPLSVIQAPKREHSRKPDEAYELIEAMYPNAERLELFARTQRGAWTAMGNEVGKWEP